MNRNIFPAGINFAALLLAALVFLLSGCNTFEKRVKEKATVFVALDAATQARLKAGQVNIGDSTDMAYIALGVPDEAHDQASAEGAAVVWVYNRRWQEYQGERVLGYRASNGTDPKTGAPTVYYQPVAQSVYRDREEERLRVTFKDDKITVIERPKL